MSDMSASAVGCSWERIKEELSTPLNMPLMGLVRLPSNQYNRGGFYIYANPVILGGLFANGKDMGRCLPMLNRQRNNKML